jgi:DNA-directed RNA polymerase subunit RPC12/RpoP
MMTDNDRHLDGNAIGGLLQELFGREMTQELGCCGNCGAISLMGETVVYLEAPGSVVRCPACGSVLLVAVALPTSVRGTVDALRWIDLADSGT